MPLANYTDLNARVANWLGRADLTSRIPEGIALAEAKMNRRLREKDMVTKEAAFSINGEYVAVPSSFGGVKNFWLNTGDKSVLLYMPDSLLVAKYANAGSGEPRHYNVQGSNFHFGPTPDATYSATLIYYLKVPPLQDTGSASVNWMIRDHPDAYLYGVNAEMAGFAKDWEAAEKWVSMMYAVLDEIKRASNRDSYGGDAVLAARPG